MVGRVDAAKILGRQAITVLPLGIILMLTYVGWRFADDNFGNIGVKITVAAAVLGLVAAFTNSASYGQIREDNPDFLLGQFPPRPIPRSIRMWQVSRGLLLGFMVVAMMGFIITLVT